MAGRVRTGAWGCVERLKGHLFRRGACSGSRFVSMIMIKSAERRHYGICCLESEWWLAVRVRCAIFEAAIFEAADDYRTDNLRRKQPRKLPYFQAPITDCIPAKGLAGERHCLDAPSSQPARAQGLGADPAVIFDCRFDLLTFRPFLTP